MPITKYFIFIFLFSGLTYSQNHFLGGNKILISPLNKNENKSISKSSGYYIGLSPGIGLRRENKQSFLTGEAEISLHFLTSVISAGIEHNSKDSNSNALNFGVKQLVPFWGTTGKSAFAGLCVMFGIGYNYDFRKSSIYFDIGLSALIGDNKKGHGLTLPRIRIYKGLDENKTGAITFGLSYSYLLGI